MICYNYFVCLQRDLPKNREMKTRIVNHEPDNELNNKLFNIVLVSDSKQEDIIDASYISHIDYRNGTEMADMSKTRGMKTKPGSIENDRAANHELNTEYNSERYSNVFERDSMEEYFIDASNTVNIEAKNCREIGDSSRKREKNREDFTENEGAVNHVTDNKYQIEEGNGRKMDSLFEDGESELRNDRVHESETRNDSDDEINVTLVILLWIYLNC